MPVEELPSGLVVSFREWVFDDMQRWAKKVEGGGSGDDLLVAATVDTLEEVIDPGPYGFLKAGASTIDADRLLKRDVEWWLYRARAASHPDDPVRGLTGEDYVFDWQCSRDPKHEVAPKKARLCDMKVKPLPESSIENVRTGKPLTVTMPNGDVVAFDLPTMGIDKPLRDLMNRRTKEARRRQKGAKAVEPTQAEVVACQIVSVSSLGENQSLERRAAWVGKLKFRDWAALERELKAAAPDIDRTAKCTCDECGQVTVVNLPLTPGFFLPIRQEEEAWKLDEADLELDEFEKATTETASTSTQAP